MSEDETITIKKDYYDRLKKAYDLLLALQECGVDNWEGYSEAIQLVSDEKDS